MEPLWVDKYRPRSLDRLDYHPQITQVFRQLADTPDFPHLIIHGPEGAGKKTRIYAFLSKLFGDHVYKLKQEERTLKPEGTSTTIQYSIFTSNYHIEMTPSDNDQHDKHIVQYVVKEIAGNSNVESKSGKGFKILIINEADKLSKDAQGGLRRTMEKYMKNCRMVLVCNHVHKLIHPIRSRCLNIRIPAPDTTSISNVLAEICKLEAAHSTFSPDCFNTIALNCQRNLRLAIIQLQMSKHVKNPEGALAPYLKQIHEIAQMILKQQSPSMLKNIRQKFYDLLVNCIEGPVIMKELLKELIKVGGQRQQSIKEMIHHAAEHQRTLLSGSKEIYHLQSYAAHLMEQVLVSKNNRMSIE